MSREQEPTTSPPGPELLPALIESLLFIAGEPQDVVILAKSLGVSRKNMDRAVDMLLSSRDGRGILVQRHGDMLQLATIPEAAPYLERLMEVEHGRLSRAALETLAIIAYRQPVTRSMIDSIRGVNSDHAVATLVARGLIEEVGRAPGPGRPALFASTSRFLERYGLQHVGDLPTLPEIEPDERQTMLAAAMAADAATAEAAADDTSANEEPAEHVDAEAPPATDDAPEIEPTAEEPAEVEAAAERTVEGVAT